MLEILTDSTTFRYNVLRTENGVITFSGSNSFKTVTGGQRAGSDLPNWRKIIASGGNATTVFSSNEYVLYRVPVHADCYIDKNPTNPFSPIITCDFWGDQQGDGIPSSAAIPGSQYVLADTLAREQFLKKYRKARTAFQSGVFFGELRETIRMIKSPAKALREGINDYYRTVKKRLRREKRRHKLKEIVGNTWLEYAFGWRPLIRDVEDAVSLACASPDRYKQNIGTSTSLSHKTEPQRISRSAPSIGYPYWYLLCQQENTVMIRYKGAAQASMGAPPFPEQLGLSWSNVLPTVWELIPFSFLVDYFTNIGDVIEGISTGVVTLSWGMRQEKATRSVFMTTQSDLKNLQLALGHKNLRTFVTGAGVTGHRKEYVRIPIDHVALGHRDLRFEIPGANSLKWLNIAALATLRT